MEELLFKKKLEHIESVVAELKDSLKNLHKQKKIVSLRGIIGEIEITEKDIAKAKKSLFPYNYV